MKYELPPMSSTESYGNGFQNASDQSTVATNPTSQTNTVFQCIVLVMGMIGASANGFVIIILVRSELGKKKATSSFIINQLALDLFSCVSLILTYIWKLAQVKLTGVWNFILCLTIGSEDILWVGINGSITNLVFITLERYAKIVFQMWHRNYYRNWMTYICIGLAWLNGFLTNFPTTWISTDFPNCQAYIQWPNQSDGEAFGIYFFMITEFIPLLVFIICYWHILLVIRKSGKMFNNHDKNTVTVGPSNQGKPNRGELSIIKTMVIITVLFAVCWTPNDVYFLLVNINCCPGFGITTNVWYGTLFLGFLTICIHPFIYGTKSEAVKHSILKFFGRKNSTVQPVDLTLHS